MGSVSVRISDLSYRIAPENVIGTPREFRLGRRDRSRLLVVKKVGRTWESRSVQELPQLLRPGDVVVLNNSKRIPGVLHGRNASGGKIELRFVDLEMGNTGLCRIFPMHDVAAGNAVNLREGGTVDVLEMGLTQYNLARVRPRDSSLRSLLKQQGTPILGFFYDNHWGVDELNPFYASEEGSVESPLAGLHFTPELISALQENNVEVCFVTLHSVGSWLPFMEADSSDHTMWAEFFKVTPEAAAAINSARARGGRIIACGSTSLRAVEAAAEADGTVVPQEGKTQLYCEPGYQFKAIDAFFTNFHQQQTSLIVLDCAFAGQALVKGAYREATELKYGFYEFGDAVLYLGERFNEQL